MAWRRDNELTLSALRWRVERGLSRRPLGWRGIQLSIAVGLGAWLIFYATDPNDIENYNRLTEAGQKVAGQLELFLDGRVTDLGELARCGRAGAVGTPDIACGERINEILQRTSSITAFGARKDCAQRDEMRERCAIPIYRAAEVWDMPAARRVARWSAQSLPGCPVRGWCTDPHADDVPKLPPWVRNAYHGSSRIVVSHVDGRWVSQRESRTQPYLGVFHLAMRTDDGSAVVVLDLDHAHVAEFTHQLVDVRRAPAVLPVEHLGAGEWLEWYRRADYLHIMDDRGWALVHPKPWHIVGSDARWGSRAVSISQVFGRVEGEFPLRLCDAQDIPRMSAYYRAIDETIRLRRPSHVGPAANLSDSPRMAVAVAVRFNRDQFAWSEDDDPRPITWPESPGCQGHVSPYPPLFALLVVGQHLRELSHHQWFLWTLYHHRWAILIALFAWLTLADPIHRRITRRRSWVEWRPSKRLLHEIRRAASSIDATTEGASAHLLEMMRNALVIALPRPPRVCCVALDADRLGADALSLPWERLAPRESDGGDRARWLPVRVYSPGPTKRWRRGARHKACYGFFSPEHDPKYPPLVDRDGSGLPRREAFDAFTAKVGLAQADNIILGAGQEQALADLAAQCGRGLAWLHLVCHGDIDERGGFLVLTDEFRETVNVYGDELAASLSSSGDPPLVVVLEACCSGLDARGVAAALIRAGVEAVVCFRGKPRQDLVTDACRRFYAELAIRRRLDLAVLATRATPQTADDASDAMSIVIAGERSLDVLVDVVSR